MDFMFYLEQFELSANTTVQYRNEVPYDSIDRVFALWLIDHHPEVIGTTPIVSLVKDKSKSEGIELMNSMLGDLEKDFVYASNKAYDNYEREGVYSFVAFFNLINVAQKGRDAVLTDSYRNGEGWFGAS